MKTTRFRKAAAAVLSLTLAAGLLAGCATKDKDQNNPGAGGDTAPLELTWSAILYTQQPPKDTILKIVEEKTNTKLNITWVPDAVREDKLNTSLASPNTLTKVVSVQDIKNSAFRNAAKAGLFWEIGPYLKDYPNLSKMNETILANTAVDGKLYGIYRERPLSRQGVIIRQDWLDNLGMKAPTTIDELYEVLKAFTLNDPNKSGRQDTFGLTDRNDLMFGAFKTLSSYFGTPNQWGLQDGKLVPEFMYPAYMDTMNFMRKLYQEKLVNDDFAVTSKNQQWDKFNRGQAGVYIGNMVDAMNLQNSAEKINPNVKLDIINRIAGPDGQHRVWSQAGHHGMFVFPKTAVKTEAELKRILAFFDQMATPEMWNLLNLGIEGVHYNVLPGGYYETIAAAADSREQDIRPLNTLVGLDLNQLKTAGDPLREKYEVLVLDNLDIVVPNPAEPLESATFTERGNELNKIINDATYKYILGQINASQFQAEVDKWKRNGGDKIIAEFNASYAQSK